MILDLLENLEKYKSVIPFTDRISSYLRENDIYTFTEGKYQIAGESAFILIQEYESQPESEREWESHRKYIDIQLVLNGEEYIAYSPVQYLEIRDAYNAEEDIIIYQNGSKNSSKVYMPKNMFTVFFPDDAHKPCILAGREKTVKKAVIKTAIS